VAADEEEPGVDWLICLRALWDRVAGWALVGTGATLLVSAASQTRGALHTQDQLALLMSGGLGGLALAGLGCTLLISAGLRDEWRSLHDIEQTLVRTTGAPAPVSAASTSVARRLRAQWDRVLGCVLLLVAGMTLLGGSRSTAASLYTVDQAAYLVSAGLVALLLVAVGAAVLVLADLRDSAEKVVRLAEAAEEWGSPLATVAPIDRRSPVILGGAGVAVGGVILGLGWAHTSNALTLGVAMEGFAVGVAGVGLAVTGLAGASLWLRHRVASALVDTVTALSTGEDANVVVLPGAGEDRTANGMWTADGLERFHRTNCPALTTGGRRRPFDPQRDGDLEPCLLCSDPEPGVSESGSVSRQVLSGVM
jgi:hypothetical protein